MEEKTVESVVAHFKLMKMISYGQYSGSVNEFRDIIAGNDDANIAATYYPGKDIDFFKQVLKELGEI